MRRKPVSELSPGQGYTILIACWSKFEDVEEPKAVSRVRLAFSGEVIEYA